MFLLQMFGGLGLLTKVLTVIGLVVGLYAGYAIWRHQVYTRGWNDAIAAIAAQDSKAIGAAQAARSKYRECVDRGMRWDQSTGQCDGR